MKPLYKKIPTFVGFSCKMQDFLDFALSTERVVLLDDESEWYLSTHDKVVIKHKGKIIPISELSIVIEETREE